MTNLIRVCYCFDECQSRTGAVPVVGFTVDRYCDQHSSLRLLFPCRYETENHGCRYVSDIRSLPLGHTSSYPTSTVVGLFTGDRTAEVTLPRIRRGFGCVFVKRSIRTFNTRKSCSLLIFNERFTPVTPTQRSNITQS